MSFQVYNSLTKSKEPFRPLEEGRVRMYNCGPTVYNRQHIGNFRSFLFADTLRRWLEYLGYDVLQVMNITDVGHLTSTTIDEGEDKMEAEAKRTARSTAWAIAPRSTPRSSSSAGPRAARASCRTTVPRATDYIPQMVEHHRRSC